MESLSARIGLAVAGFVLFLASALSMIALPRELPTPFPLDLISMGLMGGAIGCVVPIFIKRKRAQGRRRSLGMNDLQKAAIKVQRKYVAIGSSLCVVGISAQALAWYHLASGQGYLRVVGACGFIVMTIGFGFDIFGLIKARGVRAGKRQLGHIE